NSKLSWPAPCETDFSEGMCHGGTEHETSCGRQLHGAPLAGISRDMAALKLRGTALTQKPISAHRAVGWGNFRFAPSFHNHTRKVRCWLLPREVRDAGYVCPE